MNRVNSLHHTTSHDDSTINIVLTITITIISHHEFISVYYLCDETVLPANTIALQALITASIKIVLCYLSDVLIRVLLICVLAFIRYRRISFSRF